MADTPIPQDQIKLPAQSGKEIGQTGTYLFSGFISGEEYNNDLRGKVGLQTLDIMRRSDPTIHGALMVCKNPIIAADWVVLPASDDAADVEIADYVHRELFDRDINWQDILRQALSALDFGHCVFEKVLAATEFNGAPRIGLAKIAYRKQRSIMKWAIEGDKPGITQILPAGGLVQIPRSKLVYVVNEQEGDNYEGISLLRYAYKPWKIKDSLEIMNAIALERMSLGIPILRVGDNNQTVSNDEVLKARAMLQNIRNNERAYLELPAGITIEMLDMKASQVKDTLPTIQHEDRQILLSVLAQFLALGSAGAGGSRSLSEDQTSLYLKSLEAVARTVQQAFQRDVVQQLVDLNYSNLKNGYPKLTFSNISDNDVSEIADAISKLMSAGAITADRDLENSLRKTINVPLLPKEIYDTYGDKEEIAAPADPGADKKNVKKGTEDIEKDGGNKKDAAINEAKQAQAKLLAAILEG